MKVDLQRCLVVTVATPMVISSMLVATRTVGLLVSTVVAMPGAGSWAAVIQK